MISQSASLHSLLLSVVLVILLSSSTYSSSYSADITHNYEIFNCCSDVSGPCRNSCENLSLVDLAADTSRKEKVQELKRFCSSTHTEFWKCMNRTMHDISRGSEWSGRHCCTKGRSPRCQNSCAVASNRTQLKGGCRQSDEMVLFECLDRQYEGDDCCGNARTSDCLQACREIFRANETPTSKQRSLVAEACSGNTSNAKVVQCLKKYTDLTPIENPGKLLPCCEKSSGACKATCRYMLLLTDVTQEELIDALQKPCGPIVPHTGIWQCFFVPPDEGSINSNSDTEISQINQIGMDSAKLHCCYKAASTACRRLCQQTYSNEWTVTRAEFDTTCYSHLAESALKVCLDEVEEPCELGCDGLSFCSNFNNRPTELFRSCNTNSDIAAHADVRMWQEKRHISILGIYMPIKDVSKCSPEMWRAIACTLQVKPCTRRRHINLICRDDCYGVLGKCLDWTRLNSTYTAASICQKLAASEDGECVSLKPYLEASDFPVVENPGDADIVSSPCRGHPCNSSQVCLVNRNSVDGYSCVTGCKLGEASSYLVPAGSFVRIPISQKKGCLKICQCSIAGRIENCQPLPCVSYDYCTLTDRRIQHASWFKIECNICSCFIGDVTCTKRQCRRDEGFPMVSDRSYTSLPCNCLPHHVPVCGKNGYTYPSACVARCAGLQDSDIEIAPCRARNPCDTAKCPLNSFCVVNRQVCLSVMHRPCMQHECVNISSPCAIGNPACDTMGRTHASMCHLIKSKSTFAYHGHCFRDCYEDDYGPACGINGITYHSECEAWSDYSLVDYFGHCQEIGLLTDTLGPRCTLVKCPRITTECQTIVPPGACCPICAGAIRVLFSRKQIDRALYALKVRNTDSLTLKAVLQALDRLVKVEQCRLSGFLTIETDIFVTVQSVEEHPSQLQAEVCAREAEKISTLIETQSHWITSDLVLSALTVANVVPPSLSSGYCFEICYPLYSMLFLVVFCFFR